VQELCDALVELIAHPKLETKDLLKFIKGPDFPTGGSCSTPAPSCARSTSPARGRCASAGVEAGGAATGGQQIVVTSIPYTVNKSSMVAKFGDLVRERKLPRWSTCATSPPRTSASCWS